MDIDSGYIFQELEDQWEKYDRNFVKELESIFRRQAVKSKVVTYRYQEGEEGADDTYIVNYRDKRYPYDLQEAENEKNFPFPDYYLEPVRNSQYPCIVSYWESRLVPRDDKDFVILFSLKLSLTDEMEIIDFLNFQLKNNFKSEKSKYKEFLELILIKHKEFLANGKTDVITNKYISEKLNIKQVKKKVIAASEEKRKPETLIKWTNNKNNNDFVKIIYALYESKLINNGEGEVTKIVEQAANIFGVELSKSWQANFSKNKNNQNNDYDHTIIFEKMKTAYLDYLNKHKKN
jgi:hypothetical protein